jgi:hypothetical protein
VYVCAFHSETLGRIICLIESGAQTPVVDDTPQNFFAGAFNFEWIGAQLSPSTMLERLTAERNPSIIAVFRNPETLFDRSLLLRMLDVLADCDRRFSAAGWLIAAPEGVDENGVLKSAVYSLEEPRFLFGQTPSPVAAIAADAYLVNVRAFAEKNLRWPARTRPLEEDLLDAGYKAGLISVFHPRFALAAGKRIEPRIGAGTSGATLKSEEVANAYRTAVTAAATPASVSIVVRTIFNRPHLLQRLLVSVLRAEIKQVPVEVILASDAPDAERKFAAVVQEHRRVPIRFAPTPPGDEPSRNRNLKAGAAAAKNDYIWFIDDDDYVDIFAFSHLKLASIGGARPLIFANSDVHEETWTPRAGGAPVLSQTRRVRDYPASGWRDMFIGINQIPICGCIAPREFLQRRLAALPLRHDLSEDYALFLAILTAPDLPDIVEIEKPLSHISQRSEGENTMQMSDRTPWVRHITSYLSDLSYEGPAPGLFQVLAARARASSGESA